MYKTLLWELSYTNTTRCGMDIRAIMFHTVSFERLMCTICCVPSTMRTTTLICLFKGDVESLTVTGFKGSIVVSCHWLQRVNSRFLSLASLASKGSIVVLGLTTCITPWTCLCLVYQEFSVTPTTPRPSKF